MSEEVIALWFGPVASWWYAGKTYDTYAQAEKAIDNTRGGINYYIVPKRYAQLTRATMNRLGIKPDE